MVQYYNSENGPVIIAAKKALETGNPNYVLIWVPEESENTLKNLLEKTFCERSTRKNIQNRGIDWYFESVNRLHFTCRWPHCPGMTSDGSDMKMIVSMVERAFETGNCEEICGVLPIAHTAEVKLRFHNVMNKRNYTVDDIAAGRAYVSAFIAFIAYLHNLSSVNPEESDHTLH